MVAHADRSPKAAAGRRADTFAIPVKTPVIRRPTLAEVALVAGGMLAAERLCTDWIAAVAVFVLCLIWWLLPRPGEPPVLAMAMTFQWTQVTIGVFYNGLTGRVPLPMILSDYRPMVLIGLGCVTALTVGLKLGSSIVPPAAEAGYWRIPLSMRGLLIAYGVAVAGEGTIGELAYEFPDLTQAILAVSFTHLGLLFLLLRRMTRPTLQWPMLIALVGFEILLGMTGFFAGFRDPLVMLAIALLEAFNPRRMQHWLAATAIAAFGLTISVMWMGVRNDYRADYDFGTSVSREERLDRLVQLAADWWQRSSAPGVYGAYDDLDALVDRMWVIYYPALAVSRVPAVLPHTDGAFLRAAVQHSLSPRVFFPDKAKLQSDSENVRKYSGVFVASTEQDTSIAFGYAAEAYIDFGVPWMFLPIFLWGLFLGAAYASLVRLIQIEEVRIGVTALVFWLALYLFERSWVKTIGLSGTLLIYLGLPAVFLDRYLGRVLMRTHERLRTLQHAPVASMNS
jgi:hypothetical protein